MGCYSKSVKNQSCHQWHGMLLTIHLTLPWSRRGGKITPQVNLLAAISKPHGTNRNASATFPRYGWATKWHNYCIYIVTQKSKMAAANASNFLKNSKNAITQIVFKITAQFQRLYLYFLGPGVQWSYFLYCVVQAEVRNPRWRFSNYRLLHTQMNKKIRKT